MKLAKRIAALALALCILLPLAACGKSLEETIVGTWTISGAGGGRILFYSSGTFLVVEDGGDSQNGTWAMSSSDSIDLTMGSRTLTWNFSYISSDSLTVTSVTVNGVTSSAEIELLKSD